MHCTLKGTGGEEEDPPDVLWLRDGLSLHYTDTNQFQVHTGSNSWTVMSTLRWVDRPCSALLSLEDKSPPELFGAPPVLKMSEMHLL